MRQWDVEIDEKLLSLTDKYLSGWRLDRIRGPGPRLKPDP